MTARDYWSYFAGEAERLGSPLYARLARGIGGDDELRALAESGRAGQPPANLILGAVHLLLRRGADHPLRDFYPDLNGGEAARDADPFPAFRDFVTLHRDAIAPIVAARVINTNEVGRSGALHAGFRVLARSAGEPLHLIEIGPSAGLNLIWDRYGVRYVRDGESFATESPDAQLVLDVALRGAGVPPLGPAPRVAGRVGLERDPVDLDDADARDWLEALVWPEHHGRRARLEQALAIYRRNPPHIRAGDALELLPDALAMVPADATPCVYHTIVTYQFSHPMREALDDMLVVAGLRRPVWRLALEYSGDLGYPLRLTSYRDGAKSERTLALCDPHGAWLEWRS